MDPVTIGIMILGIVSAAMSVGQAVETYTLWRLQAQIPEMVEKGAIKLVSSEKFRTSLMKAASKEIAKRLKLSLFGEMGAQKKLENQFAGAVLEGDDALQGIKGMLPKKAQEMLDRNPQLIEMGLRLLPQLLEKFAPGDNNGQS